MEVYDLNQEADSKLANLSTRAFVSIGDDIVIAGFCVTSGAMTLPWEQMLKAAVSVSVDVLKVQDTPVTSTVERELAMVKAKAPTTTGRVSCAII